MHRALLAALMVTAGPAWAADCAFEASDGSQMTWTIYDDAGNRQRAFGDFEIARAGSEPVPCTVVLFGDDLRAVCDDATGVLQDDSTLFSIAPAAPGGADVLTFRDETWERCVSDSPAFRA